MIVVIKKQCSYDLVATDEAVLRLNKTPLSRRKSFTAIKNISALHNFHSIYLHPFCIKAEIVGHLDLLPLSL